MSSKLYAKGSIKSVSSVRENIPTKLNSKLKKSVNFVCSVKEKSSPTTLH